MPRIHILPSETARLIAAGEVIDRPAAALRELLDNAVDASATEIEVRIEEGGIALLSVSDNGVGMDREDLELSVLPHATSKIESAQDLLRVKTLGFRGEALASMAAAARLEIVSSTDPQLPAWKLVAGSGMDTDLAPSSGQKGTRVTLSGLFERYPARRQFLKRPQAESAQCRQIFTEKALAHPRILFRWLSSGGRETLLASTLQERIVRLYPEIPRDLIQVTESTSPGFSLTIAYCGPSFHRNDRRLLQIFINRRKVQEWGLSTAVEQAFAGYLPGGMKPCAFVLLEIEPSLADFNIHPAKREVRLKDADAVRRGIIQNLRSALSAKHSENPDFLRSVALPQAPEALFPGYNPTGNRSAGTGQVAEGSLTPTRGVWARPIHTSTPQADPSAPWTLPDPASLAPLPDRQANRESVPSATPSRFTYLGQALGPFLIFEMDDFLYILDYHAAHERILYDRLDTTDSAIQKLLVPIALDFEETSTAGILEEALPVLSRLGFTLLLRDATWFVDAVPAILGESAAALIIQAMASADATLGAEHLVRSVRAGIACKSAIKDGEILDRTTAEDLIARALELPDPRCPHGRPVWTRISREHLYTLVGRIV